MTSELPILKLDARAVLPTRAHPDDAGLDLYALEALSLEPGKGCVARTGIAVALPSGHVGLIADRSSLAKRGLKTAGGVIDAGYRGEIGIVLWNLSSSPQAVAAGERLAQLLILPVAAPSVRETPCLDGTLRGAAGFGSTGR
ncbi:MAG: dUTP diphosphatase [Elusimicrobia bacterium]|nr:dUTP diphosphatase [Elusimicrobiota bacterium]MDE2426535.1 dUTP diphosphatase [Elusimicrobiota bacterium]